MIPNKKRFGQFIKRHRLSRNMTQTQLAKKMGADQTYISQMERSKCGLPTVTTIFRFAKALRIHPLALFSSFY